LSIAFGVIGSLRSRQGDFLELVIKKLKRRKTFKAHNDKYSKAPMTSTQKPQWEHSTNFGTGGAGSLQVLSGA
jgi:hypothetical protein